MGLVGVITWPLRTTVAVITHLLRLCFSIVLFPYRITCSLVRSFQDKANSAVHYIEEKIQLLKRRKPVCYFFPSCQTIINKQETLSQSETDSGLKTSEGEEEEGEGNQSIASLIQDLIKLSQPETRHQLSDSRQSQQEKIQLLLQELTELAESSGVSSSQGERGLGLEETTQEGEGVSVMLKDLSVLESYLSQFLEEQQDPHTDGSLFPDRTNSLETIIEETTSKESSPYHPGSPLPPSHRMKPLVPSEGTIDEEERDLSESQNEISQTLLMLQKVTNSKELKETLQQLAEMHKQQNEFQTPPTSLSSTPDPAENSNRHSPPSNKERHEALTNQLADSQQQMDSIVNSLVQQQKVMTCQQELLSSQQELQNVMDSLTSTSTTPPKTQSTTPTQDQLYDSLASIKETTSTYAKINKPRPLNSTPATQEDIYDSIQPLSSAKGSDETPPPIPRRRTGSDVSTDSCDNYSPKLNIKKKRSEEERSTKQRRSVRKHSSFSHRHHKGYTHDNRDHSSSDDSQDESDYTSSGRRGRYESSGYDSHQDIDSPVVTCRRGRRHSDVNVGVEPLMTPPSSAGKRSFFGFFGKKSTSLTSLSSNKSGDASERASISSYKM